MDFSLVVGGPLYQLFLRTRLLKPPLDLVHRRILAVVLITWLPLVVLTALTGTLVGGVAVPFLFDLDVHVRFLLVVPLLIASELIVHRRMRILLAQFAERELIAPADQPRFDAIIRSMWKLRNSSIAEVSLLLISITGGYLIWRTQFAVRAETWFAIAAGASPHYTLAGVWYVFVALTIARFILLRWYFRLCLWYVLMWRVSRLELRLNPLHPDRCAGLAFLGDSIAAFIPVLVAQTILLSGMIGNHIWHDGARLPDFTVLIVAVVVFLMLLTLLPLAFFGLQLAEAKRASLREYGATASRYAREFRERWLLGHGADKELLGSPDIQSLADLGSSYDVARETRLVPVGGKMIVRLAILLVLPLLPLALTMVSFRVILDRLIKMLL